ncbi:hypothetical protein [Nocardia sp. NPDC056100]|uniref:hypothetical protein n=1 Tax=Nocardia sp. NPDC056100 TaxID=3345712 RepID=UPI0035D816E5
MDSAILSFSKSSPVVDPTGSVTRNYEAFSDGMYILLEVQEILSDDGHAEDLDLIAFRSRIVELMKLNEDNLWTYVSFALDSALQSSEHGWLEPSMKRSVIQFLLDEYPGMLEIFDDEDRGYLDEMDEFMRERGPLTEAIPESMIPAWVPASHWWWRHATWTSASSIGQ